MRKKTDKKKINTLSVRIMTVVTVVLTLVVGVLCTSPSKAAEQPYIPTIPDETEPAEQTTDAETTAAPDTIPADITFPPQTDSEQPDTEPYETADTSQPTDTTSEEQATQPVTTPSVTTATVTTAPDSGSSSPKDASGEQVYRPYTDRQLGENETIAGSYETDRVSVTVSHVEKGTLSYFICDIKLTSVADFHTAFAGGKITGRAYTSKIASSVGAGFAMNGDFCGFRNNGIIIREGALYRSKNAGWDICYLNKYGDLITDKNDSLNGQSLVNDGVYQSWCFGPTLVKDYKALTTEQFNTPDLSRRVPEPRTAIGQVDKLHYIFLVVDAQRVRNGISWNTVGGMTFTELAQTFESLGCKVAYNLDGGGSTTLYLNGAVINKPCMEGERQVSDIIYFK